VFNLKRRIKDLVRRGTPTAMILDELFERVCKFDTAFSRLRAEQRTNRPADEPGNLSQTKRIIVPCPTTFPLTEISISPPTPWTSRCRASVA